MPDASVFDVGVFQKILIATELHLFLWTRQYQGIHPRPTVNVGQPRTGAKRIVSRSTPLSYLSQPMNQYVITHTTILDDPPHYLVITDPTEALAQHRQNNVVVP